MSAFDTRVYAKTERVRTWVTEHPVSLCWTTSVVLLVWILTVLTCR